MIIIILILFIREGYKFGKAYMEKVRKLQI